MIRIIDYGLGNIQAFLNTYKRLDVAAERITRAEELDGATHVILPGVGSFDRAMTLFNRSGFREPMEAMIAHSDVRVLGICVGMQMLALGSDEGRENGLGWVPGHVRHFDHLPGAQGLPRPHMGWNDVMPAEDAPLFRGGLGDWRCYFLHSYYFECESADDSLASAEYGERFTCAVGRGRVFGVQFHPEKSHHWGQAILGNFARI